MRFGGESRTLRLLWIIFYWFVYSCLSPPLQPRPSLLWCDLRQTAFPYQAEKKFYKTKWSWNKSYENTGMNNASFLLTDIFHFVSASEFWLTLALKFETLITKSCYICVWYSINFKQILWCCVKIVQKTIRKLKLYLFPVQATKNIISQK